MSRLLVFADIHGSLASWLTIRALLKTNDRLAIAGDLFDTRYGHHGNPDFMPDDIRADLKAINTRFYYIYGNCDVEQFCPGYRHEQIFEVYGKTIGIHHGHKPFSQPGRIDLLIQGHTHLCNLEQKEGLILMNPGSITAPRNGMPTYGIITGQGAFLVALKTGKKLAALPFD